MTSPSFQSELIEILQRELGRQFEEPLNDSKGKALGPVAADAAMPVSEIIDHYQHLFASNGPVHIEKRLMDAFSQKEFQELGLLRYLPKIYRGLPRLYQSAHPARSHIKKNFAHLPSLKRAAAEKAIFSLYENFALEPDAKVCLFTWVIGDGYGDYTAAIETAEILSERFPSIDLQTIVLMPENMAISSAPEKCTLIYYGSDDSPAIVPHSAMLELRLSDLILFLPTSYPHTAQLTDHLKKMSAALPMPKMEAVGEYGYIESSWFHPRTRNRSMGLHFLEKGVLIRKNRSMSFAEVKNERLLQWLFNTSCPGPVEIEHYLSANRFYTAYLTSPTGGAVYLHALLKSMEHDAKGIDLCVPDLGWFVQHADRQNRLGLPVIQGHFAVKTLEVWFEGQVHSISLGTAGKKVRLFCTGLLSQKDFRTLLSLSGEFAAIRGDQSFSEAVSANKVFFYDGREHARYFVKDLLALAENRIGAHRGALTLFRGIGKTFLHNLPDPEGEWVDETYFQEKEEWLSIALEIGAALQDPDTVAGFKKLNRIIADECSCNDFLCHLIRRSLCHKKHPEIEKAEEEQLALFSNQAQSFLTTVKSIQRALNSIC